MDMMTRFWFELAPVFLAVGAAALCAVRASIEAGRLRWFFTIATVSCVLLILAQTSWWSVLVFELKEVVPYVDDDIANMVWTLFNTLTMIAFIISAYDRRKVMGVVKR